MVAVQDLALGPTHALAVVECSITTVGQEQRELEAAKRVARRMSDIIKKRVRQCIFSPRLGFLTYPAEGIENWK